MQSDLPPDWDSRRKRVYQRDNYTCQNCGVQAGEHIDIELHAHHIVPKSRRGSHQTSNLITLCKECHATVHSKSKQAPTPQSRKRPDFGELSDSILNGILQMIDNANEVMAREPEIPLREYRDYLSENATQLRSTSLKITNAAIRLEEANRQGYSEDVVVTSEAAIAAGIDTIEPMLEAVELLSEELDEAIKDELTCPECDHAVEADAKFCSNCGTELDAEPRKCVKCSTEFSLTQTRCPSCGYTHDLDDIEIESNDIQQFMTELEQHVNEMEDAALRFQAKMEERTETIENHQKSEQAGEDLQDIFARIYRLIRPRNS